VPVLKRDIVLGLRTSFDFFFISFSLSNKKVNFETVHNIPYGNTGCRADKDRRAVSLTPDDFDSRGYRWTLTALLPFGLA